jgi:pyruvate, water dikinase
MTNDFTTYTGSAWDLYRFNEEVDLEVTKCWALAISYSIPVRKPFHHWALQFYDLRSFAWAADQLMLPSCKGLSVRSIEGLYYVGLRPTTVEEQKQRETIYRERMKPWIEDFEAIWRGQLVPEMMANFEHFKDLHLTELSNFQLLEEFEYYLKVKQRTWEIHFLPMYATYSAYREFKELYQEIMGVEDEDNRFKRLMTGFKTKIYEVDRELWRLGDRAVELGLDPTFKATPNDEQLLIELEKNDKGKEWLSDFYRTLNEYGWRTETLLDCCPPTWIEKPTLALPAIRGDLAKGGGFIMDEEFQRLVKEREETEKEVVAKVPTSKREWFQALMKAAQWAGVYSEEHNFTVDCYMPAIGRHILMEIGQRATKAGLLDEPDDICFMVPEEIITRVLANMETQAARRIVRQRKEEWQGFTNLAPKMVKEHFLVGDPEWFMANAGCDPIMWVLAAVPKVKPELKADLYGSASAPGVAEGTARVLTDLGQLNELEPGEILVVPSTNPSWHPAFNFIKGAVTDSGGAMCHAIIVAREYGLPCVAGTQEGTIKIKTGDRIRVDGDNNAVYILDRPK